MSDVFTNTMGSVMVVAPSANGRLASIAETKKVAFGENLDSRQALTRWVFADFAQGTLEDEWGNRYDHQVHSLLSGTLEEGHAFLKALAELGCIIDEASELFVPFQKLNIDSAVSSDSLRTEHARAFALARRGRQSIAGIVTEIRDAGVLGG